jgi:hypothetical protein
MSFGDATVLPFDPKPTLFPDFAMKHRTAYAKLRDTLTYGC